MELAYIICHLTAADVCEQHRMAVYGAGPTACMIGAQAELARNIPVGWRVAQWRCDAPTQTAELADEVALRDRVSD